jgi:hypothetical protein
MCPSTGGPNPIVMFSRHQYERAPAIACDLHELATAVFQKCIKLASELRDRRRCHGGQLGGQTADVTQPFASRMLH